MPFFCRCLFHVPLFYFWVFKGVDIHVCNMLGDWQVSSVPFWGVFKVSSWYKNQVIENFCWKVLLEFAKQTNWTHQTDLPTTGFPHNAHCKMYWKLKFVWNNNRPAMKKQGCQVSWYTWSDLEVQWKIIESVVMSCQHHTLNHYFVHLKIPWCVPSLNPQWNVRFKGHPKKICVKNQWVFRHTTGTCGPPNQSELGFWKQFVYLTSGLPFCPYFCT